MLPRASQVALVIKNLPENEGDARDTNSVPGLGRSPGGQVVMCEEKLVLYNNQR